LDFENSFDLFEKSIKGSWDFRAFVNFVASKAVKLYITPIEGLFISQLNTQ